MNILITGSDGFLGSHVKTQLTGKYGLVLPTIDQWDLTDEKQVDQIFKDNNIDFIIHSAAAGVRITPDATMDEVAKPNLKMFQNLAKYVNKDCPMITFGSGAEYDKSYPIVDIKESDFDKHIPKDPYGYSKYLIAKEIEKKDFILDMRIFGIYGKGENPTRVTTSIIKNNLARQPITLNQNVIFSFIYIEDFAKIVELFIQKFPKEKFINIAYPQKIETKKLAEITNSISDFKSEIRFNQTGYNNEYSANTDLLLKNIGNFPFTSFEIGMATLYGDLK